MSSVVALGVAEFLPLYATFFMVAMLIKIVFGGFGDG